MCGGIQGRRVELDYACFLQSLQELSRSFLADKLFAKATTAEDELRCRVECHRRCDSGVLTKGGGDDGGSASGSSANETGGSG